MAYVDYKCLESLLIEGEDLIATEGIGDKLKAVGRNIGKALMAIIKVIRETISKIVTKIRALVSRKNKDKPMSKDDQIKKLENEREELKNKIEQLEKNNRIANDETSKLKDENNAIKSQNKDLQNNLDRESDKHNKATEIVKNLKMQLNKKDKQISEIKKSTAKDSSMEKFNKRCLEFIAIVSQQINKGNTVLPKFIAEAKKYNYSKEQMKNYSLEDRGGFKEGFYTRLCAEVPTMASGNWSFLYKALYRDWLPTITEDKEYVNFNSGIARGFEIMIKQANDCLVHLENLVKKYNESEDNSNNDPYATIIQEITRREGFTDMLKSSITLANDILTVYATHGVYIIHTTDETM